MVLHHAVLAAALAVTSLTAPALANNIGPAENQAIDLGNVIGDAYYTVQPDGYHVTATFGTATPLRLQAVLVSGQALNVSTPRGLGEEPVSVSIRREENRVVVTATPLTN